MPHLTQHEVCGADAPEDSTAVQGSSAQPNGFSTVYKGKCHQPPHPPNQLGTFELDGTPVHQCPTAPSSQSEPQGITAALSEAKNALVIALQQYNYLYWASRPNGVTQERQDLELATAAEEALANPLFAAAPDPVPYDDFIQLLKNEGLTWLLEYTDQLDSTADFAVAPTAGPNQRRCKVGRPRGKILKKEQGDDLDRRLCCLHVAEMGFRIQVEGQQRDPWTCWPLNADEDIDVDVE